MAHRYRTAGAAVLLFSACIAGAAWLTLAARDQGQIVIEAPRTAPGPTVALPDRPRSNPPALAPRGGSAARFAEIGEQLGIEFLYERGETGSFLLPETMGGGCAWLDFDTDGRIDLFLVQGGDPTVQRDASRSMLFLNRGASFSAAPDWTSAATDGYGMGVAVGDVDEDGFDDLYVTNYGPHQIFRNHGDGTCRDDSGACGLECRMWGASAAFADLDRDGDLDLIVANYVVVDPLVQCIDPATGKRKYCGPDYYKGQPLALFENRGNGQFADISAKANVVHADSKGLGVVVADLVLDDGWPDLFVANDLMPNLLFQNVTGNSNEGMRFKEIAWEVGAAVNGEGVREANMGIACGDYDANGFLDLFVTHYYMEHDTLWRNLGPGGFVDVTNAVGLNLPTLSQLSWGTNFIDADNDGFLDLFVTSGHINDLGSSSVPYRMRPQFFQNTGIEGVGRFVDRSLQAGGYFQKAYVGRSSAAGDFNGDGRMDLAVAHHHDPPAVLRNETPQTGAALMLNLIGTRSNRSAFCARVTVTVPGEAGSSRRLVRELHAGGGYLSADARQMIIGLDRCDKPVDIEIRWPAGTVERHVGVAAGVPWLLVEGRTPLPLAAPVGAP